MSFSFDSYDFGTLVVGSGIGAVTSYFEPMLDSSTSRVVLAISCAVDSLAMVCFRHKKWKAGGACLLLSQVGLGCCLKCVEKKKISSIFWICFGVVCLSGLSAGILYGGLLAVSWIQK